LCKNDFFSQQIFLGKKDFFGQIFSVQAFLKIFFGRKKSLAEKSFGRK